MSEKSSSPILSRGTLSYVVLRCASDGAKIFLLRQAVSELRAFLGEKLSFLEARSSHMGWFGAKWNWNLTTRHLGITLSPFLPWLVLRAVFGGGAKNASYAIEAGKNDRHKFWAEVPYPWLFCAALLMAPKFFCYDKRFLSYACF